MKFDWEQIFAEGENDRVEFKRSLSGEKEIFETIGAFLNHKGGMIIVGYDEKKSEIAGCCSSRRVLRDRGLVFSLDSRQPEYLRTQASTYRTGAQDRYHPSNRRL